MDESGHGSFTLWDRECLDIIGKTAATLRKEVEKRTGDPTHFLEDIEAVIDKRGLFKVQLKKREESSSYRGPISYGVISMIRDADIIKIYEDPKQNGKGLDDLSDTNKIGSTGNNFEGSSARTKNVDVVDLDKVPVCCYK
ncbi:unnamed protein product [Cuscuta europaea]|uniref:Uncharacterized protein n=1 Tax=Cuscuta europaea TaxID=41803 RepID=A0A9P1E6V0_CUSEU|nr:unnamed protein product [Cuscuta europaea]